MQLHINISHSIDQECYENIRRPQEIMTSIFANYSLESNLKRTSNIENNGSLLNLVSISTESFDGKNLEKGQVFRILKTS